MAEGASRERWSRTSSLMCLLANAFRDEKKRKKPFAPRDFNPWEGGSKVLKSDVRSVKELKPVLKRVFNAGERRMKMVVEKK